QAGASTGGAPSSGGSGGVTALVSGERGHADGVATSSGGAGSGSVHTPAASTSSGGIAASAAVAVNVDEESGISYFFKHTAAGHQVKTTTADQHSSVASADGSAVSPTAAGIGAAVAINLVNANDRAG